MNATKMPTEELKGMLKKLYRSFYLRPSYLLRRLLSLDAHHWRMNLRGLGRILRL